MFSYCYYNLDYIIFDLLIFFTSKKNKSRIYGSIYKYNYNKCSMLKSSLTYKCNYDKCLLLIQISYYQLVLYNLKYIIHD